MVEAVLALCLLACVGALIWRAVEDRKERSRLIHLLVAATPAEAVLLDRAAAKRPAPKPEPAKAEEDRRQWEPVGEVPLGT